MSQTYQQIAAEFVELCENIDEILCTAVSHKKKLQFAASQFRSFAEFFSEKYSNYTDQITIEASNVIDKILKNVQRFKFILAQNQANSWAHLAVHNSSFFIASEICGIVKNLKEGTAIIDPSSSQYFDPTSSDWLGFHLRDIRTIITSFQSYLQKNESKSQSHEINNLIKSRIQSMNQFIDEYEDENERPKIDLTYMGIVFSPIPFTSSNSFSSK